MSRTLQHKRSLTKLKLTFFSCYSSKSNRQKLLPSFCLKVNGILLPQVMPSNSPSSGVNGGSRPVLSGLFPPATQITPAEPVDEERQHETPPTRMAIHRGYSLEVPTPPTSGFQQPSGRQHVGAGEGLSHVESRDTMRSRRHGHDRAPSPSGASIMTNAS